jgi:hypothetical protein
MQRINEKIGKQFFKDKQSAMSHAFEIVLRRIE